MARLTQAGDHFRQSDVTFWGIVALACGALAVIGANISPFMPASVFTALHSSRISGASLDQLRVEVSDLRREASALRRENVALTNRFILAEQAGGDTTRRLGALEVSIPRLLEAIPSGAEIDRSAVTAAIPEGEWVTLPADGGLVAIRRQDLPLMTAPRLDMPQKLVETAPDSRTAPDSKVALAAPEPPAAAQGLPPPLPLADALDGPPSMAIALAIPAEQGNAVDAWQDYVGKIGPLLLGLQPNFGTDDAGAPRIVAGPLADKAEADALCSRLAQVGIACEAVPYAGVPLPG